MNRRNLIGGVIVAVVIAGGLGIYVHSSKTPQNNDSNARVNRVSTEPSYIEHETILDRHDNQPSNFKIKHLHSQAALVMDANNGNILYNKNGRKLMKVASLAKLMTLYLVQRKAQSIHGWNDVVAIPNNLRQMSYNTKQGLGGFEFKKGHAYTVKELYEAAMIKSSNNAAIALGEWVAGSNPKFINMMNDQAQAWHLKARFISSSGLENDDLNKYGLKVTGGNKSGNEVSAVDMAIIAQHLLREYPSTTKISSKKTATVDGQQLTNIASPILKGGPLYDHNLNIDGLKSGYTIPAGECFVGTCKPLGKHRIITVVLKDQRGHELSDTKNLMFEIYHQLGNNA